MSLMTFSDLNPTLVIRICKEPAPTILITLPVVPTDRPLTPAIYLVILCILQFLVALARDMLTVGK